MNETKKRAIDIVNKVLSDENGELFDDYTYDDISFVLDNDEEQANKMLKHFDEIAIPVDAGENQNSTRNTSLRISCQRRSHESICG